MTHHFICSGERGGRSRGVRFIISSYQGSQLQLALTALKGKRSFGFQLLNKKDNSSLFDLLSPSKNRNGFYNQSAALWPSQKGKKNRKWLPIAAPERPPKKMTRRKKGRKAPPKRRLARMPHFHYVWKRRPHIQRKDKDNVCPLKRCSRLSPDRLQQEFNSAPL